MQVHTPSPLAARFALPVLLCAMLTACGGSDSGGSAAASLANGASGSSSSSSSPDNYSARCGLPQPASETYRVTPPTGAACVGSASAFAFDPARTDPYAPDPTSQRAVQMRVWYPAQNVSQRTRAPYASELDYQSQSWPDAKERPNGNAFLDAPVAPGAKYPVLIFSPGNGAPVAFYTSLAEELASHGYIVVAVEHPYITGPVTYPDGHVAGYVEEADVQGYHRRSDVMTQDQRFVLTWLQQHQDDKALPFGAALDLGRVGAYGHSLGGSAALQLARLDNRVKSAANLDGTVWGSLIEPWNKPWLILTGDRHADESYAIFRSHPRPDSQLEVLPNTGHLDFSDASRWVSVFRKTLPASVFVQLSAQLDVRHPDPDALERDLRTRLRAFFDRTVK